jgi:hypothetical protein
MRLVKHGSHTSDPTVHTQVVTKCIALGTRIVQAKL